MKKLFCFLIFIVLFLTPAYAQDPNHNADITADSLQVEASDELLTDDQIQNILANTAALTEAKAKDTPLPEEILESSSYSLGTNDIIQVTVLRHPEVSGDYMVNAEGKIQFEFVGDIKIEGLKKDQVKDLLTDELTKYIISPEVTVKIIGYNSKVVYVIGEVANPGKIFMRGDTITIREALIQAGLPLLSAKATVSKLITPASGGNAVQQKVNVHKLLYEGDLRENLVMKPGDTLYIPPTFLAKTMRVLQPVAAPIGTAASTGRTVTTGF